MSTEKVKNRALRAAIQATVPKRQRGNTHSWVAIAISVVALVTSIWQVDVARYESRRATAIPLYKSYLELALQHPKFSLASYPVAKPRYHGFAANAKEFAKYEFYVSNLLFATETILKVTRNDAIWRQTLKDQLKYHALYLESEESIYKHYDDDVKNLADEAIAEYRNEKTQFRAARDRQAADRNTTVK